MWTAITSGLSLIGTLFGYYVTGKKNAADKERAYQTFIEDKKRLFNSSEEQYESFEEQKKRMDEYEKSIGEKKP